MDACSYRRCGVKPHRDQDTALHMGDLEEA